MKYSEYMALSNQLENIVLPSYDDLYKLTLPVYNRVFPVVEHMSRLLVLQGDE